jgi:hypothetical protein
METIRQIVLVNRDRKVELTLPEGVQPGLVEIVVVLQPLEPLEPSERSQSISTEIPNLFGFLQSRVDPLQFQKTLRDEAIASR